MIRNVVWWRALPGALVLAVCVAGCSDDGVGPQPVPPVDEYLKSLPEWNLVSPPVAAMDGPVAPSDTCYTWEDGEAFICAETPCSITDTPEQIVTFNAGADLMWPGSLIQGHSYLGGLGTMEELPIRQRAPLTVSIDMLVADNAITIENPDLGSVNAAVGMLIERAWRDSQVTGSAIFYEKTTAHSVKQAAIRLGLSAKYMGGTANAHLSFSRKAEETTVAAFFKQRMFTVSVVQPQMPEDFFTAELTPELLQEQVELGRLGPTSPPVYVSQIVYGRMLMLTMTSSSTEDSLKAALDASYDSAAGGGSGSISGAYRSLLENARIQVVAVGGNASNVLSLIRSGELGDYFKEDADLTSAMPIAYSLRTLRDNTLATVAESTDYTITECDPGEIGYFDSESEWRRVANAPSGSSVLTFFPNRDVVARAQGVNDPPTNNQNLPAELVFEGALLDPPLPFDFMIACREKQGSNFTYNDTEFNSSRFPMLSVGDEGNAEDDDFEIRITRTDDGVTVTGIAVDVGDNDDRGGEWLEVYDDQDNLLEIFTSGLPQSDDYVFMGVTGGGVPIGRIFFNEDDGPDDICLQGIWFAIKR